MDHLRGTDEALVAQLVNGNMAAFEELMERYRNAVYHTAFAILGDWADAEDVVQEVFLSVLNNAHRFRGDSSFKTWVFRICTNSALNWRRQLRRRVLGFGRLRHEYASTDEDVLDVMLELQKLSPVHRATVALRYLQDLPEADVARIMNCPAGTVKSRVHYALEHLRSAVCLPGQRATVKE